VAAPSGHPGYARLVPDNIPPEASEDDATPAPGLLSLASGTGADRPLRAPADRTAARTAAIIGGLIAALLLGFGLGRSTNAPVNSAGTGHTDPPGTPPHAHDSGGPDTSGQALVGGIAVGQSATLLGYRMVPTSTTTAAGRTQPFTFTIVNEAGVAVTDFVTVHDKPMHLVLLRRDLSGYQHLHPTMAADGTWSVPLRLPEPGIWRAYADFTLVDAARAQIPLTLGIDVTVPGDYQPRPLPAPAATTSADGFTVAYEGTPRAAAIAPLAFRITRAGVPAALDRYLGSYGHLVVVREIDLGYVHVHADVTMAGDTVQFWLAPPSPGRYRLFLDFQVGGTVHHAAFTINVS